ncbi:MAG: acyl carrier protein [Clostridia bacterium]|jgi:acyl carrier protein|nr:acyl carrier protein [Clostridia bacterium]
MYEEFRQLLIEKLEIEPDLIKPESQLANDLGINSLELADLVLFCEDKYGIEIDDDALQKFITVNDVVEYLSGLVPEQ